MEPHLTTFRRGFEYGRTQITTEQDPRNNSGIAFSILKMRKGEKKEFISNMECALLHLEGDLIVSFEREAHHNTRHSLFDEPPFAVHFPNKFPIKIMALSDLEVALFDTKNDQTFPQKVFYPQDISDEHRGKDYVDNTSLRFVRTIFDGSNSHPNTKLVLGEVVNFPGRWSSYPPHHHPQPEIYHYRFTDPKGYGHAELGDYVFKVKQYDSLIILDGHDHAQCSAPGYGMYYLWVIRHLENSRYTTPEFNEDHKWTMSKEARFWQPKLERALCH